MYTADSALLARWPPGVINLCVCVCVCVYVTVARRVNSGDSAGQCLPVAKSGFLSAFSHGPKMRPPTCGELVRPDGVPFA
jgi:hypothetical protein